MRRFIEWVVGGALNENHGLRTGNLEAPATTLASQHVVDADHVIAGFLKTGPILFICAARRRSLSRAL